MFKSIDEFKQRAEFFPKGRIVPQRIMKGTRKNKHRVKFEANAWALPVPRGYLIASDNSSPGSAIIYLGRGKLRLECAPYVQNGSSVFVGKGRLDDDAWLAQLNATMQNWPESGSFNFRGS